MKKILFYCTVLFFAHQMAFAQRDTIRIDAIENLPILHEWLRHHSRTLTHFMGLTYLTPEGFTEKPLDGTAWFGFTENRFLNNSSFLGMGPRGQLQSDDGEMVAFFNVPNHDPFLPRFRSGALPEVPHINNSHIDKIRSFYNEFHRSLALTQGLIERPTHGIHWRESANFFSTEEARSKFNADTAFFLTLRLLPGHYYQDKFGYIDVFGLQKNGRGFIYIFSFYTETAMQNIECYRQRLWGSVRFAEEHPPYILDEEGERRIAQQAERWMAQEPYRIIHPWLSPSSTRILTHDMRLNFQVSDGFQTGDSLNHECFEEYLWLWSVFFSCFSGRVQSNDSEHLSFLHVLSISTRYVDTRHLNHMRAIYNRFHHHLQFNHGRDSSQWQRWFLPGDTRSNGFYVDWHESAYFFSPEETRTKFNADTAAFFTLTLPSGHYYLNKYRYIDVFMLQKAGRGYIQFISFYTEEAKQNIDWYRRRLWGSLRYED